MLGETIIVTALKDQRAHCILHKRTLKQRRWSPASSRDLWDMRTNEEWIHERRSLGSFRWYKLWWKRTCDQNNNNKYIPCQTDKERNRLFLALVYYRISPQCFLKFIQTVYWYPVSNVKRKSVFFRKQYVFTLQCCHSAHGDRWKQLVRIFLTTNHNCFGFALLRFVIS